MPQLHSLLPNIKLNGKASDITWISTLEIRTILLANILAFGMSPVFPSPKTLIPILLNYRAVTIVNSIR